MASLDAAHVSRQLAGLATDVRRVLAKSPGQARQMSRKLFTGHRIECRHIVEPDGSAAITSGPKASTPRGSS